MGSPRGSWFSQTQAYHVLNPLLSLSSVQLAKTKVRSIVQNMVNSPLGEVASQGASQVTARWFFHGYFESEFRECCKGTTAQRKGVADVSALFLNDKKYSKICQEILYQFMDDPDSEVRKELRSMFRENGLFNEMDQAFIRTYVKSQSFADDPQSLIWGIKEFMTNLIPISDAIFAVCEEFATSLRDKTRDFGSRYTYMVSEISSALLRLYEQAQGEHDHRIANRCLDIWDLLFENRVGRIVELTKAIEQ